MPVLKCVQHLSSMSNTVFILMIASSMPTFNLFLLFETRENILSTTALLAGVVRHVNACYASSLYTQLPTASINFHT